MRACGVLLPVSALPGRYGIGDFSKEAYNFVDWVAKSGQRYWQILPLGPTGYGDSPYQPFSTFAGNPYFISLDELCAKGLLSQEERRSAERPKNAVDYADLYETRFPLLKKAYLRFEKDDAFFAFYKEQSYWLKDYALYRTLKEINGGAAWHDWDAAQKYRKTDELERLSQRYEDDILFYVFLEYEFMRQWRALKSYANERGIRIIGDLPIYVSMDSADAWSRPELFMNDEELLPTKVAGCPPDYFSRDGQLWGNPVYDWEYHKADGYDWWIRRLKHCFELYDVLRLDHFRGFASYYAVPFGDETARNGEWLKGPGMDFFNAIRQCIGDAPMIAEDLGMLTPDVFELLRKSGLPGMKVLEFAFDDGRKSMYLPHRYDENCVVYTGTHDNDTLMGWLGDLPANKKDFVCEYLDIEDGTDEALAEELIRLAIASRAELCIIPLQDYLLLGSEARINTPSTVGGNWSWRMEEGLCTDELAGKIARLLSRHGR